MSEEIPYVVIDPGEEETFMLKHICKGCGSTVEFSAAELFRCGDDIDRPRPKCAKCGRPVQIGPMRVWSNESGNWEEQE